VIPGDGDHLFRADRDQGSEAMVITHSGLIVISRLGTPEW